MSDGSSTTGLEPETLQRDIRAMARFLRFCGWLSLPFVLLYFGLGPVNRQHGTWSTQRMQDSRLIGYAMLDYAEHHEGRFPEGNSSTEVFQRLLDFEYQRPTDVNPGIFYIPLPGKIEPIAGQKLKPENVCWDVTCCADSNSSDLLPLVFLTGYKVTYAPGGSAVTVIKPFPPFIRTWSEWWNNVTSPEGNAGIAVFYKGNLASFLRLDGHRNPDDTYVKNPEGIIPNFVSPEFDPKGATYRQLTPDGPLP